MNHARLTQLSGWDCAKCGLTLFIHEVEQGICLFCGSTDRVVADCEED